MDQVLQFALPEFSKAMVILLRVAGILSAWPVLRSRAVPYRLKALFALCLVLVLLPLVTVPAPPADTLLLTAGLGAEFIVGLVLGLGVRFVFEGISMAGELMGVQMGLGAVQLIDPTASGNVPLLSNFNTILASLLFVSLDGHLLAVQAISQSFLLVAPFGASVTTALVDDVLRLSQGMFALALKIAAPVMATILMLNLLLAILGRAVPQMNVFILSFTVTIAGGVLVMGMALPFAISLFQSEFLAIPETVGGLLRALGAPAH